MRMRKKKVEGTGKKKEGSTSLAGQLQDPWGFKFSQLLIHVCSEPPFDPMVEEDGSRACIVLCFAQTAGNASTS